MSHTEQNDEVECIRLLLSSRASVDVPDKRGMTALAWAALRGNSLALHTLIAAKADVNHCSEEGMTPLMWAASGGHVEAVRVLLEANASVTSRDTLGRNARDLAQIGGYNAAASMLVEDKTEVNQAVVTPQIAPVKPKLDPVSHSGGSGKLQAIMPYALQHLGVRPLVVLLCLSKALRQEVWAYLQTLLLNLPSVFSPTPEATRRFQKVVQQYSCGDFYVELWSHVKQAPDLPGSDALDEFRSYWLYLRAYFIDPRFSYWSTKAQQLFCFSHALKSGPVVQSAARAVAERGEGPDLWVEKCTPHHWDPDTKEWVYRQPVDPVVVRVKNPTSFGSGTSAVAMTPSADLVVGCTRTGNIMSWEADKLVPGILAGKFATCIAVSPDRRYVAYAKKLMYDTSAVPPMPFMPFYLLDIRNVLAPIQVRFQGLEHLQPRSAVADLSAPIFSQNRNDDLALCAFSPDSALVAFARRYSVFVYDIQAGVGAVHSGRGRVQQCIFDASKQAGGYESYILRVLSRQAVTTFGVSRTRKDSSSTLHLERIAHVPLKVVCSKTSVCRVVSANGLYVLVRRGTFRTKIDTFCGRTGVLLRTSYPNAGFVCYNRPQDTVFSRDGSRWYYNQSVGGILAVYDAPTGKLLADCGDIDTVSLACADDVVVCMHEDSPLCMVSRALLESYGREEQRCWQLFSNINTYPQNGYSNPGYNRDFTLLISIGSVPDAPKALSGGASTVGLHCVQIVDASTHRIIARAPVRVSVGASMSFTPDGRSVLVADAAKPGHSYKPYRIGAGMQNIPFVMCKTHLYCIDMPVLQPRSDESNAGAGPHTSGHDAGKMTLRHKRELPVELIDIWPTGRVALSGGYEDPVQMWDLAGNMPLCDGMSAFVRMRNEANIVFSPDLMVAFCARQQEGAPGGCFKIERYNTLTWEPTVTSLNLYPSSLPDADGGGYLCYAVSPDGQVVFASD